MYENYMYPCEIEGGLDRGRCQVWAMQMELGCDTEFECDYCRKVFYQNNDDDHMDDFSDIEPWQRLLAYDW